MISPDAPRPTGSPRAATFARLFGVEPGELAAAMAAAIAFFLVFAAYYVLRPIRDEIGAADGIEKLPWLFTGTLVVTALVHPPFAALVARLSRRRAVAVAFRSFAASLALFWAALAFGGPQLHLWASRAFYVWTSVFNLFVVAVFWSVMADLSGPERGRRIFGLVSVGGTLGAMAGSALTASLVATIGAPVLLLVSALLLEVSLRLLDRLARQARERESGGEPTTGRAAIDGAPVGGGALGGLAGVARSPYLWAICAYMLLFTIASTFLYFQQAAIAGAAFADRAARTAFFARIDLAVNALTLGVQLFLAGRVMRWLGVGLTLAVLPAASAAGFALLAAGPTLAVVAGFQVLRRTGNFALARPTREVLYTVLSREEKYKAKHLIDTVVYRAGDQIGAWSYAGLTALGVGLSGTAWVAVPLSLVWLALSLWLGFRHLALVRRRAAAISSQPGGEPCPAPAEIS